MAPRGTASTSSPSVSARRHSQRPTTAFPHRQGRGSPGASKSEDITIALATSFDASGWNTARHLVRPRWVIGRSHTVNSPPLISLRQTLGQGLAFTLGVLGASCPASGCAGACGPAMKPIYEIYGGRPVWETASGHPWVTLVLVVFAPVAILVLSCLYRSHNPLARLWGSDQGLPWRQVAVSVDHGARFSDGTTTEPRSVHHL